MSYKILIASACSFISLAPLSAQSFVLAKGEVRADSALNTLVHQLEQNAILTLLAGVVLMGIIWIVLIWKEGADLKPKSKNIKGIHLSLFMFVLGLSVLGSSCTAVQMTRAADARAARSAESPNCVCPTRHSLPNNYGYGQDNNHYPYNRYSNWNTPSFCTRCGKRIY